MSLEERVAGISGSLERHKMRHELLDKRVDDQGQRLKEIAAQQAEHGRRLDRIELRLLLWALAGSAGGALIGSAGSAAAKSLFGG